MPRRSDLMKKATLPTWTFDEAELDENGIPKNVISFEFRPEERPRTFKSKIIFEQPEYDERGNKLDENGIPDNVIEMPRRAGSQSKSYLTKVSKGGEIPDNVVQLDDLKE